MKSGTKIIRAVTVAQSIGFFIPTNNDLRKMGYEVVALSSPGEELKRLKEGGYRVIEVPMERRISLIKDMVSLINLIRVLKKEKPYMVHSMTPKAGMLCMVASAITRVPRRIHTFTGLVWPTAKGVKRRILMATDWLTCACATHILPEGEGVRNDLRQSITTKPMKVLGYGNVRGVDMVRFSRNSAVMEAAGEIRKDGVFTFLFVGRIVGDKGINELVKAFIRLIRETKNVRLILVGNFEKEFDPLEAVTMKTIIECAAIEAVGEKYGDELPAYYAASDCFVFPSYREGFPNTVMEAGAMGLPSIVTDINGSREIVANGKNGIVIPSKNADALYRAMKEMITDKTACAKMAGQAREMIALRFEQGYVRKCLLEFYDSIM